MEKTYNEEEVIQMMQSAFAYRKLSKVEAIKAVLGNPWISEEEVLKRIERIINK